MKEILGLSHKEGIDHVRHQVNLGLEEGVWQMISEELAIAGEAIRMGKSVLFQNYDMTAAGGEHVVLSLFDSSNYQILLEIPTEPQQTDEFPRAKDGGRFPTLLHGLEAAVVAVQLAYEDSLANGRPYPSMSLASRENFCTRLQQLGDGYGATIPLVAYPNDSNVIVLHPKARGDWVDSKRIVEAHYLLLQNIQPSINDPLRHTMLVQPRNGDVVFSPQHKSQFLIGIMPEEVAIRVYSLYDLRRLQPLREGNLAISNDRTDVPSFDPNTGFVVHTFANNYHNSFGGLR